MTNSTAQGRAGRVAALLLVLTGAAWLVASCGGSARTGTDSHTHWLSQCEKDADCGELDCLCGRCTRACDTAQDCSDIGDGASCALPATCEDQDPATSLCTKSCVGDADCSALAPGLECAGGVCVEATTPDPDPCAPMDARSNGDDCLALVGYAFDGVLCRPVVCGCAGSECGELYDSLGDCDNAYTGCYAELGVERACETNADCELALRQCCGGLTSEDVVLAVSEVSDAFREALCEGVDGCPTIYIPPSPTLYAQCVSGQCATLEVSPIAGCDSDDDCLVRSKGCCNCPANAEPEDLIAVAAPDRFYEFFMCQTECEECVDTPPASAGAACSPESQLCELVVQE